LSPRQTCLTLQLPIWLRAYGAALALVVWPAISHAQPSAGDISGLSMRASLDYARFANFAKVSGNQPDIQSFKADNSYTGFGLGFDYDLTNVPLRVQAGLSYGTQTFTQEYSSLNALAPQRVDGDVSALFTDFGLAYRYPLGRLLLLAGGGGTWARNAATLENTYANCSNCNSTIERVHNRVTPHLHFGLEFQLPSNLRLRTGLNHIGTFNSNDADDHFRFSAGLSYNIRHSF
jgi:Outer membrane protein beta-barrel domain